MSTRLLDWRSRLVAWGLGLAGKPFAWGSTDCASLGRLALEQCFGRDVVPHVGAPWRDLRDAMKRLAEFPYCEQLEGLGAVQVPLAFVRSGDILVTPEPDDLSKMAVLVCLDGHSFLGSSSVDGVQIVGLENVPAGTKVYSVWEAPD